MFVVGNQERSLYRVPGNALHQTTVSFECCHRLKGIHAPDDDAVVNATASQPSVVS